MNARLALALLAACAGTASAQCNVSKYGVPDFDQRRNYLDNNGSMYCVPTACLNWMGYIANHGRPQALGHSSPDWSSMSEYGLVDVRDHNMGGFMDTSGTGGTDTGDAVDGLVDYLDYYDVGAFMIMAYISDEDWQVKPNMFYNQLKLGNLVSMVYGRYELDGDQWERTGGHCVTLVAVQNACDPNNCTIGFKDPWTGDSDSINTQSPFATKWWDISRQTRNYDGDVYSMWGPKGQAAGPGDTIRLIDKFIVIMPLFALTKDPVHVNAMVIHKLNLLTTSDDPPTQTVFMPDHAALLHAATDPRSLHTIVATALTPNASARLWDYDPVDGSFSSILPLPANPGAMAIDRRGDILLEISGDIYKYRYMGDGSVRLLSMAKLALPINSIAVDDATDDVYALAAGPRQLLKFAGGNLAAPPYNGPLPAGVPSGIVPCIRVACNPADGKPWVSSDASTSIFQLTPGGAAPGWVITNAVQTGAGMEPEGLQFGDHGEMKFISGDKIHEFEIDPKSGRYVPSGDPHFKNLPASEFISLARSRTNFDPRLHTGPRWVNIENPDPETPEVPDCVADYDVNGFVNADDIDFFVLDFERGSYEADIDGNAFVNGDDYDTFMDHFVKGC